MLVDASLSITNNLDVTAEPLSIFHQEQILRDCHMILRSRYGILCHVTDVSIVRQHHNNFINIRIKRDYVNTVFISVDWQRNISYCFIASDKLEPVIVVVAIDHIYGRLQKLPRCLIYSLEVALKDFCAWTNSLQLKNLEFTYTNAMTRTQSQTRRHRCHSAHFHLKLHISRALYAQLFPAFQFTYTRSTSASIDTIDQFVYVQNTQKYGWKVIQHKILIGEISA